MNDERADTESALFFVDCNPALSHKRIPVATHGGDVTRIDAGLGEFHAQAPNVHVDRFRFKLSGVVPMPSVSQQIRT